MNESSRPSAGKPPWRSLFGIGLVLALGIIFFFLWSEHRAHLLGALPLLLLLLCPVLHFCMHRGNHHGHHGASGKDGNGEETGGRHDS